MYECTLKNSVGLSLAPSNYYPTVLLPNTCQGVKNPPEHNKKCAKSSDKCFENAQF